MRRHESSRPGIRLYLRLAPALAPATRRRQRVAFWSTLVLAKALVLSPFYAPYLLG